MFPCYAQFIGATTSGDFDSFEERLSERAISFHFRSVLFPLICRYHRGFITGSRSIIYGDRDFLFIGCELVFQIRWFAGVVGGIRWAGCSFKTQETDVNEGSFSLYALAASAPSFGPAHVFLWSLYTYAATLWGSRLPIVGCATTVTRSASLHAIVARRFMGPTKELQCVVDELFLGLGCDFLKRLLNEIPPPA